MRHFKHRIHIFYYYFTVWFTFCVAFYCILHVYQIHWLLISKLMVLTNESGNRFYWRVQDAVHICTIEKSLVTPGDYGYPLLTLWVFCSQRCFKLFGFPVFWRTRWGLFQQRVVSTKLDIYVLIDGTKGVFRSRNRRTDNKMAKEKGKTLSTSRTRLCRFLW